MATASLRKNHGSVLVFALLGLIALLALAVVIISRSGREEPPAEDPIESAIPSLPFDDMTTTTAEVTTGTVLEEHAPDPVVFPPPPPPVNTPDNRNLPPEG